tara:strand:- start:120 stop:500 length:381 start_codon:yes stop_codon:yes gene_type:complete
MTPPLSDILQNFYSFGKTIALTTSINLGSIDYQTPTYSVPNHNFQTESIKYDNSSKNVKTKLLDKVKLPKGIKFKGGSFFYQFIGDTSLEIKKIKSGQFINPDFLDRDYIRGGDNGTYTGFRIRIK